MAEIQMNFAQVFGDSRASSDEVADVDVVSAIEFDDTGDYIAAGDRGGRIVVFEREEKSSERRSENNPSKRNADYKFYTEFQSHEPEFDYLKSLEIEEKINKIKWVKRQNNAHFLLSTNDKTIKLWKIYEKKIKSVTSFVGDKSKAKSAPQQLVVPTVDTRETAIAQTPRRIFANAHAYHINSISLNSDGETFISSDDLRINLWNTSISDQSFNIVDIKPTNMEELTEVITSAEFHPHHCNVFMYSSSKGTIKLADMRQSALCDRNAKVFEEPEDPVSKSFFSEIISSISDIKFSRDGRYMLSRDYMTLKIWDINMESRPVKTIHIHDHLKSKLCDLYENDCIFDKFECSMSHDSNLVLTGSYHNYFSIYDKNSKNELHLEATKVASRLRRTPQVKKGPKGGKSGDINPDALDFGKKILHVAWHPQENLIAVGASNNLYIFNA